MFIIKLVIPDVNFGKNWKICIVRETNETLLLTKQVFNTLIRNVVSHFKKRHDISGHYKDSQLYGFGNYDPNKPSLKKDLELVLKGYVNGKYLYNKQREASSGKPIIKISREYKLLFFKYLKYENVVEFIKSDLFTEELRNNQIELLNNSNKIENHYYVCYYFGEDNKMNKGQVIIYNDWKNVEMIYIYLGINEEKGVYTFYGSINQSEDFIYFNTKYYVGNKKSEGAKFIFFIGKSSPNERNFLMGTYSGFDKYDRAIAGKIILKKYNSKSETQEEVNSRSFNPIICLELNKNRVTVESNIKKNPLLFSKKSPYAQVLLILSGSYLFHFKIGKTENTLKLQIEKYHYNIISLEKSVIIEEDTISLVNKGQIVVLDFSISGLFHLQKASIYINTIYLDQITKEKKGHFVGVNLNNEIVSGDITLKNI